MDNAWPAAGHVMVAIVVLFLEGVLVRLGSARHGPAAPCCTPS